MSIDNTATKHQALDGIIQRNVDAVKRIEAAAQSERTRADILSDAIAGFCGSTTFVTLHGIVFALWLTWNSLPSVPFRFDPPPFGILTVVVSLEAIFLSTFILISQNRQQRIAEQRNHLDLQINLLAEQENSAMLSMLKRLMNHFEIGIDDPEAEAVLEIPTDPEKVAEHLQEGLDPLDRSQ